MTLALVNHEWESKNNKNRQRYKNCRLNTILPGSKHSKVIKVENGLISVKYKCHKCPLIHQSFIMDWVIIFRKSIFSILIKMLDFLHGFDQFHRWNALLCPPLGFVFNFLLIWLVLYKSPKEMRVHSRILLQTAILDILLLSVIAIGQPVLAMQPDFSGVILYQGYFIGFFRDCPNILALILAIWFGLHTFDTLGVSVQFLYRFLVLNCRVRISLFRYMVMLGFLFVPCASIAILWCFMIFPGGLNVRPFNADYFANFADSDQSVKEMIRVTYTMNPFSLAFRIWDYLFYGLQIITYVMVLFCGVKMVRYVNAYTGFNQRLRDLNRQLSKSLIILASFPLVLLSINGLLRFSPFDFDGTNVVSMTQGSMAHWLPVINPLASIITIKPYRTALWRLIKMEPTKVTIVEVVPATNLALAAGGTNSSAGGKPNLATANSKILPGKANSNRSHQTSTGMPMMLTKSTGNFGKTRMAPKAQHFRRMENINFKI